MNQYQCQTQYPLQFKSSSNITNKATSNRISTQFDGANSDIYLQYLSLNGTNGIQAPLVNATQLNTNLDYTIMMWVKPQGDQWNKRIQYILQIFNSFQCYFTQTKSLTCQSITGFDSLNASTGDTSVNQWVHITVSGSVKYKESYLLFESHKEVIGQDQNTYIVLQQPSSTWNITLGYYGSSLNFVGGIKDFIFLSQYIDQDSASILKNNYLTWDFKILGYYRFDEATYLREEFRNMNAIQIGSKSLKAQKDLVSNDICYPFLESEDVLTFNDDLVLNNMTIGSRWSPLSTNYSYSLSLWIKPNKNTCFEQVPYKASRNCNIVQFYGSFMIFFDTLTSFRVYFFAKENYYEIKSSPLFAPLDQWVNIQLAFNQYFGYTIKTYDMQGREMQSLYKTYNMQEQSLPGKTVGLLQNFRGHARNFIMWSKYATLPLTNSMDDSFSDKNIMFYFKFQPQYNSKSGFLTNYGDNSGVTQNGIFNKTAVYEYQVFYDSLKNGTTQKGLITSDVQLFDGIACNDNKLSLQMVNYTSYVKGQTSNVTQWMNETTVEFWFRPYDVSTMNYLFSLYSNTTQHEFFTIYYNNANEELECAPFGSNSITSPILTYDDLTESNIQNNKWFHLACSYSYQNQIAGYLHSSSIDATYTTDISTVPNYLPKDIYNVYIGNSYMLNQGSPNIFFKDLRIWAEQRSVSQISSLRYQQLNPLDYSTYQLIGYFRMTEASFNEFNYESLANNKTQKSCQINQIQYTTDSDLVICPQATYYFNNSCYDNPFDFLLVNIFPVYNSSSNSLAWNITNRHSSILDDSIYNFLQIQWSTSDSVVNQLTSAQSSSIDMILPSSVFADQSIYQITSQITNDYTTFVEQESVQFLPISCQWVITDGSDAYSGYLKYLNPQSTKDITLTLKVQQLNGQCDSYYDTLLPNITYDISPPPSSMPILSVTQTDSSTLVITLPREEQYKLGVNQDNKIILSVYWTNSQYSKYIDPTQYTFQNVLYTINFAYQVMTVIPVLNASSLFALFGDSITLDASQTYLTTLQSPDKYSNLTFSWLCPFSVNALCSNQASSILVIAYSDFLNNGGVLNQSLTFDVQIVWASPDGTPIIFYDYVSLIWYGTPDPSFSIQSSTTNVMSTKPNTFQLLFDYYDSTNVTSLSINWSIVPNISSSSMIKSSDNTSLYVNANAFNQNYKYTVSVSATNKINSIAQRSKALVFTTTYPPYGGTAKITPSKGYYNYTNFTVYLQNWTSSNQPIQYQVWQTNGTTSSTPQTMISAGWVQYQNNFTFQSNSSNPYIVIITDQSQEIVYSSRINVTLSAYQNTTSNSSSSSSKMVSLPSSSSSNIVNSSSSSSIKSNSSNTTSSSSVKNSSSSSSSQKSSSSSSNMSTNSSNATTQNSTNNTGTVVQVQLVNLIASTTDLNQKYVYMNDLSNSLNSSSGDPSPKIQVLLDQMQQDNSNISSTDDDTSSSIVIGKSAQILNNILSNTSQLDDTQVTQSLKITDQMLKSPRFGIQIVSDQKFLPNYAQSLSSLLKYSNQQVAKGNRRRNLQTKLNIASNITRQISSLSNSVCSLVLDTNLNNQQTIETASYQIQLYKFGLGSNAGVNKVSSYTKEDNTFVALEINKLIEEVKQIGNIDASSLCAQTIYYIENPMLQQMNQQRLNQYSDVMISFDIVDGSMNSIQQYTDLQLYTQLSFQASAESLSKSQSVCMENSQLESFQNVWTPKLCLTSVLPSQNSATCYCKQSYGSYFALATNQSISYPIFITNSSQSQSSQSISSNRHSFAFLSFILTMIIIIIFFPVVAYILDRRDIKCFQEKIENKARLQLLVKVSQLSNQPLSYWIYKQDQVLSYNFRSISLFSHMIYQMHPLMRIISKFDIQESRIIRFTLLLLQLSIYSLICVQTFSPSYRSAELLNGERNEQSIDQKDINTIIIVGIVGMIVMLPLPASISKCLRSKYLIKNTISNDNKQVTDSSMCNPNNQSIQRAHIYTQDQNAGNISGIINKSVTNILGDNSPVNDSNLNISNNNNESLVEDINIQLDHDLVFKPQCTLFKYSLLVISYMIAITSIVLSIVYSQSGNQFNQYCMISAFYIGLFGSLLCTNVVKIFVQSLIIKSSIARSEGRCVRLLVSSEARKISEEIAICREAEKALLQEQPEQEKKAMRIFKKKKLNKIIQHQERPNSQKDNEIQNDNIFQDNRSNEHKLKKSDSFEYLEQNEEIEGMNSEQISPKKDRVSDIFQQCSESVNKSKSGDKSGELTLRRSVLNKTKSSLEKHNKTPIGSKQVKYTCVTENGKNKQDQEDNQDQ